MNQYFDDLIVPTEGFSMHSITRDVEKIVSDSGLSNGLCQLSVLHTSASLLIQENASSDVQRDIVRFLDSLAPMESGRYEHDLEGLDDMPAHLKAALTQTHLTLSIRDSRLVLGTWQGIFLLEHRTRGSRRYVHVHLVG
ncbi:MAG: YjbQ family protein [Gammaproteobacteria bacterium]|nr:YjbQ family protein [Gammaproteobacteria bacterium]